MSDFSIGTINPIPYVLTYDGFDRPNTAELVTVLSDGTPGYSTQVLQQSGLPMKRASLRLLTYSEADIDYLRGIYETRESVVFTDCDGHTLNVRLFECTTERGQIGRRYANLTLIEA